MNLSEAVNDIHEVKSLSSDGLKVYEGFVGEDMIWRVGA